MDELSGENRVGPDTTFNGNLDNRFAIAGNVGDSPDEAFASLKSPLFESFEHPQECFSFWFYFGVRLNSHYRMPYFHKGLPMKGRKGEYQLRCGSHFATCFWREKNNISGII